LETVLYDSGAIFQYYGNYTSCVSDDSRTISIDDHTYAYSKIKDSILLDPIAIRDYGSYRISTPERALCDYIYLHPKAQLDDTSIFEWTRLRQILALYPKKTALTIKQMLDVS